MNRRKTLIAVAIAGGVLALSVAVLWHLQTMASPFDRTIWHQGEQGKFSLDAPRLRMADGLIRSHILIGKTRSELEAMLGPATRTDKFRDYGLVYWLGAERGFMSIDSEWLVIRIDKSNKAFEASIVSD